MIDTSADTPSSPSAAAKSVVPHDIDPLLAAPKGIYVDRGGTMTLRGAEADVDMTYRNLPNASYVAVRASQMRATGITAASLIAGASRWASPAAVPASRRAPRCASTRSNGCTLPRNPVW